MIGRPALPSDPPPAWGSPSAHRTPMTLLHAALWSFGATLVMKILFDVTASVRPAAREDLVTAVLCQALAYGVAIFAILRVHAPESAIRTLTAFRPTDPVFLPLAAILGVSLQLPMSALYEWLTQYLGLVAPEVEWLSRLADAPLHEKLGVALVVVGLGPLTEECLFRGALFTSLRRAYIGRTTTIATAGFFALVHPSLAQVVPILMVGLVLGLFRWQSGSLVPGLVLHATFNATPVVVWWLAPAMADKKTLELPISWTVGSAVLSALMVALAWTIGQRSRRAYSAARKDI